MPGGAIASYFCSRMGTLWCSGGGTAWRQGGECGPTGMNSGTGRWRGGVDLKAARAAK